MFINSWHKTYTFQMCVEFAPNKINIYSMLAENEKCVLKTLKNKTTFIYKEKSVRAFDTKINVKNIKNKPH